MYYYFFFNQNDLIVYLSIINHLSALEHESEIRLNSLRANRRTFRYLLPFVFLRGYMAEKYLRAKHVAKDKRDIIRDEMREREKI